MSLSFQYKPGVYHGEFSMETSAAFAELCTDHPRLALVAGGAGAGAHVVVEQIVGAGGLVGGALPPGALDAVVEAPVRLLAAADLRRGVVARALGGRDGLRAGQQQQQDGEGTADW